MGKTGNYQFQGKKILDTTNLPYLKQFGASSEINTQIIKDYRLYENLKCDMGGISNQWEEK